MRGVWLRCLFVFCRLVRVWVIVLCGVSSFWGKVKLIIVYLEGLYIWGE